MRATLLPAVLLVLLASPAVRAQSLAEQARSADLRGQLDSAYDLAQLAAKGEPDRAEVQALLGGIACEKAQRAGGLGRYGPARKCKAAFSKAVALEPTNASYLEDLAQFLSQAPGIFGGDRDSALALAATVRRLDEPRGTFLLAGILRRGKADEQARADSVVEAWTRKNGDRAAQFRVANYWAATNRPDRALEVDEKLVASDTTDRIARFGVGRNLVVLKRDPRRAQMNLRYALNAPPPEKDRPGITPGAACWRLGQTYVQLRIPDSARVMFERALQINPKLMPARASLDSLVKG